MPINRDLHKPHQGKRKIVGHSQHMAPFPWSFRGGLPHWLRGSGDPAPCHWLANRATLCATLPLAACWLMGRDGAINWALLLGSSPGQQATRAGGGCHLCCTPSYQWLFFSTMMGWLGGWALGALRTTGSHREISILFLVLFFSPWQFRGKIAGIAIFAKFVKNTRSWIG